MMNTQLKDDTSGTESGTIIKSRQMCIHFIQNDEFSSNANMMVINDRNIGDSYKIFHLKNIVRREDILKFDLL